jgi:hypothetical protein
MGVRHKQYPLEGLQFHPESFLTECGHELLRRFLLMAAEYHLNSVAPSASEGRTGMIEIEEALSLVLEAGQAAGSAARESVSRRWAACWPRT